MPKNYRFGPEMRRIVREVLKAHPLGEGVLTNKVLDDLIVYLCADSQGPSACPRIDCACYPLLTVRFGSTKYERDGEFDKQLFKLHMCHEFTHLVDRRDPAFAITKAKEDYACTLPQGIVMDLWNLYVNGRLWRKGVQVESFEEFRRKVFGRALDSGRIRDAALEPFQRASESDRLAFDDLTALAEEALRLLPQ
ncbi:MAG: hypothetical protein HYX92_08880 [Chloroflexi bacterium]|nr:hypothetical protein [Chloroflexota bacterium]